MAGRTSFYGGIVLDGLVFHIDSAKQESYSKRGLRYMQNGSNNLFVDFADTYIRPSINNATGSIIGGATFSNFTPYHLTPYTTPYFLNTGNLDILPTESRNSTPIWSTLEHSWDANGNTDDGKGTAHGIVVTPAGQTYSLSTMTYQSGKVGSGAFSFNGSNFISLPENTLKFTSDFSTSLWFYAPTGITNSNLISSFHNTGDYTEYNGWSISYNTTNKSISFFIGIKMGATGNPGSQYYGISLTTGNNVFLMDQWNHVLITRKANTRSRIYVNGVLSTSDTNIYNPSYHTTPNLSYIGASYYAFSQPFYTAAPTGLKIDVIETFTSELNSTDASNLYTMSNIYSSIALNNNGIGTFYGNIEFDGVDDYVSFSPTPEMNGTTDITVSSWFYVNKFRSGMPFGGTVSMIASRYGGGNGWELYYDNSGIVHFGGRENGSQYIYATSSMLVKQSNMYGLTANGGWYNAVGIKKGDEWSISVAETNTYIHVNNITKTYKGILKHQPGPKMTQSGTGTIPFTTNNLVLGKDNTSNAYYMNGRLMNLSIYNRALSLEEVNQNYESFSKRIIELAGVPIPLKEFEYMIVTYQYRSDDFQRDLDSATFFMNTGTAEDYKRVGCGQNAPVNTLETSHWCTPDGTRTINNSYLYQAGDDAGNGLGESIVINFKQMGIDGISQNNNVRVELYAGWCLHGTQVSGDIANVSVKTYIGGTMTIINNVIDSNGAIQDSFVYSDFPAVSGCCGTDPITGKTNVGTIYYNLATKETSLLFHKN